MNKKRNRRILLVSIIVAYAIYAIYCEVSHNKIVKDGRYTIAKVTDFKMNFRNGYTVYYEYDVSNHSYKESMLVSQNYTNIVGHVFFVRFDPEQPKHSFIQLEKPASFKFGDAPPEGWDKIPE